MSEQGTTGLLQQTKKIVVTIKVLLLFLSITYSRKGENRNE
jgi:hypothetical protein